jgi:hypothetical protein
MADLLASYHELSASSPRPDVSKVLNAIITGLWLIRCPLLAHRSDLSAALSIDNANRAALVTAILSDITSCGPGGTDGRLHHTGTYHSYFPTISHRTPISQMFISLSRPSRLWVVTHPGRPS